MILKALEAAGMLEKAFRQLAFVEDRFANRPHVQDRKGLDMTSVGLTRIVDQASAHGLLRGGLLPFGDAH